MRLCWDIETNGLLHQVTKLHCIAVQDVDTRAEYLFTDSFAMNAQGTIADGLELLQQATRLIGHNLINYDHPVLEKLTGVTLPKDRIFDTLVACRLIWGNVGDIDNAKRKQYSLGSMFGNQSLAAWGVRMGGSLKMDYAPVSDAQQPVYDPTVRNPKRNPMWEGSIYTAMMGEYCQQDVQVNTELFLLIENTMRKRDYSMSMQIEHDAAWLLSKQERNGFKFDDDKATMLLSKLAARREVVYGHLMNAFVGWWVSEGIVTPDRNLNYKDPTKASRVKGAPFTKVKWVDFNPSSRQHIIRVLKERGWEPTEFTPSGEPKVDESILKRLKFPEAALMAEWFLLQKRLGQLADGNQAWLNVVHPDGFIRGSVNPNGAVTGRATHSFPNVAQVPSVKAPFGKECRELFTVPDGWVLMGADASGLELRCLAHFMVPFDDGAYMDVVLNGDIHMVNKIAAGLATRDEAKTFIYSFLYGCGPELTGEMVGYTEQEYERWKRQGSHVSIINRLKKQGKPWTRDKVCNILKGNTVQKKFMKGLPALKQLIDSCKEQHKARGYVMGLDGRRIYTRSAHAALNTLLQGAGAIICKEWIVETEKLALKAGLKHGFDGDFAFSAWVHDEIQVACRTEAIAKQMGELSQQAMRNTQQKFNFRCTLDTEAKIGANWKDTH